MSQILWSMPRDLYRKYEMKVLTPIIINLRRTPGIRRRQFLKVNKKFQQT